MLEHILLHVHSLYYDVLGVKRPYTYVNSQGKTGALTCKHESYRRISEFGVQSWTRALWDIMYSHFLR